MKGLFGERVQSTGGTKRGIGVRGESMTIQLAGQDYQAADRAQVTNFWCVMTMPTRQNEFCVCLNSDVCMIESRRPFNSCEKQTQPVCPHLNMWTFNMNLISD